ncbi:maleylacetate reductase [Nitratireductor mangrovi]|uniref:Maleylacetate reductase n=1 Tax=Nitratireductor mangrovi TaxID=2599600 RepID=A0A5B8KWC8_9HYPH|nr:maleylacetate reductase [Nitratireductor mangrovi]QDY99848.1 maleylacetate reductase [Nitratireductor mangrovi]
MTLPDFTYVGHPVTVVFGRGASRAVGEWIERIGCRRALVLSTPQQAADAEAMAASLGDRGAGVFAGAAMHTPVAVTEQALVRLRESGADCLVALGGGSTTGLGKAIALRTDLPQIVIPTTYAGSEVTDILGQTEGGTKTTLRDPRVRPEVVIYDPDLTFGLPVAMSVTSGLNAMAHAAEALYARDRNPISTLMAVEGLRAMRQALPVITGSPSDAEARTSALYGAWLCGTVLGTVGMALHHKICHTLGGTFDTPHAETHAIMLPYSIAYNAGAVPDLLAPIADIFGAPAGVGLWDFARMVDAPASLRELGLSAADLDRAAEIATANPYWNPRPVERDAIGAMLHAAWRGDRPQD